MKSQRLRSPLPGLAVFVKEQLKQRRISVPALAKRMNVQSQTAYRLLRRNDWLVSEVQLVGELIGMNLFEFYTPKKIQEAARQQALTAALSEEVKELKKENALLREIAGAKRKS